MQTACPHCKAQVTYDEARIGETAGCPMCHKPLRLPAPECVKPKPPDPPPVPEPAKLPRSNEYKLLPEGCLFVSIGIFVGLAVAIDVLWLAGSLIERSAMIQTGRNAPVELVVTAWTHLILVVQAIVLLMICAAIKDR